MDHLFSDVALGAVLRAIETTMVPELREGLMADLDFMLGHNSGSLVPELIKNAADRASGKDPVLCHDLRDMLKRHNKTTVIAIVRGINRVEGRVQLDADKKNWRKQQARRKAKQKAKKPKQIMLPVFTQTSTRIMCENKIRGSKT